MAFDPRNATPFEDEEDRPAFDPANASWEPYEEPEESGFLGRIWDAGAGGAAGSWGALRNAYNVYTGDNEDVLDQAHKNSKIEGTEAQDAFMSDFNVRMAEGDNTWAEAVTDTAAAVWENPEGAMHEMVAQMPNMAVALGGMKAGAMIGTALGPAGTAAGATVGGIVGGILGLYTADIALETGFLASERSADGTFDDEELDETLRQGAIKGAVIGTVDTFTLGISRALMGAPGKAVEGAISRHLTSKGIDATKDAVVKSALMADRALLQEVTQFGIQALSKTMSGAKRTARGLTAFSLEGVGEATGEYAGSSLAGLEASPHDAVMEGLMAIPFSFAELHVAKTLTGPGMNTRTVTSLNKVLASGTVEESIDEAQKAIADAEAQAAKLPADETQTPLNADEWAEIAGGEIDTSHMQNVDREAGEIDAAYQQREDQELTQTDKEYRLARDQQADQDIESADRQNREAETLEPFRAENAPASSAMADAMESAGLRVQGGLDAVDSEIARLMAEQDTATGIDTTTANPPQKAPESTTAAPIPFNVTPDSVESLWVDPHSLKLSKDVPQFKEGGDPSTGVVKPLEGVYDPKGVTPIVVWKRYNGDMEIITGRHKWDLAKRGDTKQVFIQVMSEAEGFTKEHASIMDAQLNIRDNQGEVTDYATYFKNAGISEEEAQQRSLLSRHKGRAGFSIANNGSELVYGYHQSGQITDRQAEAIANAAPNNEALQTIGLDRVNSGASIDDAVGTMQAVQAMQAIEGQAADTGDMFAFDDSGLKKAKKIAKRVAKIKKDLREKISAVRGAANKPEIAAQMGVDVKNPEAIKAKMLELQKQIEELDSWPTNPALRSQLIGEDAFDVQVTQAEPVEEEDVEPVMDDDRTMGMFGDPEEAVSEEEGATDMFGEVPVKEQALADAQREKDEKRDGTKDVPADADGGMFSNQKDQTDLEDKADKLDAEIEAAAKELAELLKPDPNKLNSGVDPQVLIVGAKLGALYVQKGTVKFALWAKELMAKLRSMGVDADQLKPHLKKIYAATQQEVSDELADQMDDPKTVRAFDLETLEVSQDPVETELTSDEIDKRANEAATSPENDRPEPINLNGQTIVIENPRDSERKGTDPSGKAWSNTMGAHYGDIKGTIAADGDALDVFVGENPESTKIFVMDQQKQNGDKGGFDEHKVFMGFTDQKAAEAAYLASYDTGWGVGPVTELSVEELGIWISDGDTTTAIQNQVKGLGNIFGAKKREDRATAIADNINDETTPTIFKNDAGDMFYTVTLATNGDKKYQVTVWDKDGPISDSKHDTAEQIIRNYGYGGEFKQDAAQAELDALVQKKEIDADYTERSTEQKPESVPRGSSKGLSTYEENGTPEDGDYFISSGRLNEMFTLRSYHVYTTTEGQKRTYSRYIANLSTDFEAAVQKAREYLGTKKRLTGKAFELGEIQRRSADITIDGRVMTPEEISFTFGKHEGSTLAEIEREAPDYIAWLKGESDKGSAWIAKKDPQMAAYMKQYKLPESAPLELFPEAQRREIMERWKVGAVEKGGAWIITGVPYEINGVQSYKAVRDVFGSAANFEKFGEPKGWKITGENTREEIESRIVDMLRKAEESESEFLVEAKRLREESDKKPSENLSDSDAIKMVSKGTAEALRLGEQFGIPRAVTDDQIADVGKILDAYNKKRGLFLLANEAGTGKTFVLGGAIREMRAAGAKKFVYITMNRDLINQIKKDLEAYGVEDVQFDTYANVSTGKSEVDSDGAVLIFDETHNVGNIESARGKRGQDMMAMAEMTVMASATPFENPAQAQYMAGTGFFEDAFGGDYYQWLTGYGGTVTYFNDTPQVSWTGTKQDGKDARQFFFDRGIMTYRPMQIPSDMVDSTFIKAAVDQKWVDLYNEVETAYAAALEGMGEGGRDHSSTKMHRVNVLKRILEASKVEAGIKRAQEKLDAGLNPIIFVETKSDRHLGRFRMSRAKQSAPLYEYPEINEMMLEWEREVDSAINNGERPPPPPFAPFIWKIARAFHEQNIDFNLPSTTDDIIAALGKKNVAIYTGSVTAARATKNLAEWRAGTRKVLVATMDKGGTGLSLHDTVGDHPTAQVNINLPWVAKKVDQVSGRSARYGLQSKAYIEWLFASNIPFEEELAGRVGQRMADMGAVVKGIDVKAAKTLTDEFNFEGEISTQQETSVQREINIEDLPPLDPAEAAAEDAQSPAEAAQSPAETEEPEPDPETPAPEPTPEAEEPKTDIQELNESVKALTAAMKGEPAEETDPAETPEETPAEPEADDSGPKEPLFSQQLDGPSLAVSHNLTSDNLIQAENLGGFAVPSLAVMKADMAHGGYGDITLIGTKELGDPATTEIYDADAYTSTFPRPEYKKVKVAVAQKLVDELMPWVLKMSGKRGYVIDATWDHAVNSPDPSQIISEWLRSNGPKAMFLDEIGVGETRVVTRALPLSSSMSDDPAIVAFFKSLPEGHRGWGASDPRSEANHYAMGDVLKKIIRERYSDRSSLGESLIETMMTEDGETHFSTYDKLARDQDRVGKREVDDSLISNRLDKKIKGKEAQFQQWVTDKVMGVFGEPLLTVRKKKVPFTLENIVDYMTIGGTVAKEAGMTFGDGRARAESSKKFTSLDWMRNEAEYKILPEEQISEGRDKAKKLLEEYRTAALEHFSERDWRGEIDTWGGLDASMEAIAYWAKNHLKRGGKSAMRKGLSMKGFTNVPSELLEMGIAAGEAMMEAPLPYFEAKPERAVAISEFVGAAVPNNVSKEVTDILDRHGIEYRKYGNAYNDEQRAKVVINLRKKLAKKGEQVIFSELEAEEGVGGSNVAAVEQAIAPAMKKLNQMFGLSVQVVNSVGQLPAGLASKINPNARYKGAYHNGTVYLFAENLTGPRDARMALAHELVGHKGVLEGSTPKEWADLKKSIEKLLKAKSKTSLSIEKEVNDRYGELDKETFYKEFLAVAAERRVNTGTLGKLVAKLKEITRRILKTIGLNTFSDSEISIILANSEVYLKAAGEFAAIGGSTGGPLFSFGGEKARTADLAMLEKAKGMESDEVDRKDIWVDTGWYRGVDDKWRFEINDYDASIEQEWMPTHGTWGETFDDRLGGRRVLPYHHAIKHDALSEAYDMGTVDAIESGTANAAYAENVDRIAINRNLPIDEALSSGLHETQHAIQRREGFAVGGSPFDKSLPTKMDFAQGINNKYFAMVEAARNSAEYLKHVSDMVDGVSESDLPLTRTGKPSRKLLRLNAEIEADGIFLEGIEDARKEEIDKFLNDGGGGFMLPHSEGYRRLAGEVEARNVQSRRAMTAAQRRKMPPWVTSDIDVLEKDQIVRMGGSTLFSQALDTGYKGNDRGEAAEWVRAVDKYGKKGMVKSVRMSRAKAQGFNLEEDRYSGSTHNIVTLDGSVGNPESDWGAGTYMTSSIDDANENYAGEGPDLTSRIGLETERIQESFSDDIDYAEEELALHGYTVDQYREDFEDIAQEIARTRIKGENDGVVYPLLVRDGNYARVGGQDETVLEGKDYTAEAMGEGETLEDDYEDYGDYEDAIQERAYEIESEDEDGLLARVREAIMDSDAGDHPGSVDEIMTTLQDEFLDGSLKLSDLNDAIRGSEVEFYDGNGEMLSTGAISAQVFKNLGYDGVIDEEVNQKFGTQRQFGTAMEGVDYDTVHTIAFPGSESTVRSVNAAFNEDDAGSSDLLASMDVRNSGPESPEWQMAVANGLDMTKAARMKRAVKMGFDTSQVWYHGTANTGIGSPKSKPKGFEGDRGVAAHLTKNPKTADVWAIAGAENAADNGTDSEYGDAATVYPVYIRIKNTFDINNADHRSAVDILDHEPRDFDTLERLADEIKDAGFDSYLDYESNEEARRGDTPNIAVYETSSIRSVNAAFDPAHADSPELLFSQDKAAIDGFMDDLYNSTQAHPFGNGIRLTDKMSGLEVKPWGGGIHLSSVISFAPKGEGAGTYALELLTEIADKHGLSINATVSPIKNAGDQETKSLTKAQLHKWYKKHGFVREGKSDNILREPVREVVSLQGFGDPVFSQENTLGETVVYHVNRGGIVGGGFDNSRLPASDPDAPFNAHWFTTKPSPTIAYRGGRDGDTYTPATILGKGATMADVKKAINETKKYGGDLREEMIDRGFTHMVWVGRNPIDAAALERDGEVSFRENKGKKITLRWEQERFRGEPFDTLNLYEGEELITGYESLDDYTGSSPEIENVAVFDPAAIKSVYSEEGGPLFSSSLEGLTPAELDAVTTGGFGLPGARQPMSEKIATFRHRLKTKMRQGMVDQYASFKDVLGDPRAWMMGHMSKSHSGTIEALLEYGHVYMEDDAIAIDTSKKGGKELLEPLGVNLDRWTWWIAGNRANRLMAEGKENRFSQEQIDALMGLNAGNEELFDSVLKDWDELADSVNRIAVDTGLLSKEEADKWVEQSFYLPFYRVMDEEPNSRGPRVASSGLVRQEAYKKLKGADLKVDDLLGNALMNWNHMISASLNNAAAQKALESAENMGLAEVVPFATKGKDAVFVKVDGKEVWYEMDSSADGQMVMDSLVSLNWNGLNTTSMKVARSFKRALTYGVTMSPEFKIRNLIRDSIHATAVADMSTNITKNLYEGFKGTASDSELRAQALAGGGIFSDSGFIHGGDPDEIRFVTEKISRGTVLDTRHAIKKVFDAYQDVGGRMENVNRVANFGQAMEEGRDRLTANFESRDHLDFSRTGSFIAMRAIAQVVPFLNARLQGLDKLARSSVDSNQRKQFYSVVGYYTALSVMLYMLMKDDDDYKEAQEWEKDAYHLFKLPGSDTMYKIPRPFEVGAIASMGERLAQQMVDDEVNGSLFGERLAHSLFETFNFNPTPQMFKPALEVAMDKSWFTGNPIEGLSLSRLSPEKRKKSYTSETAIALSEGMNTITGGKAVLSPVQIQHLVRGYLGWLGASALGGADMLLTRPLTDAPLPPTMRWSEYPIAKAFARTGPNRSIEATNIFYERMGELNQAYADINQAKKTNDTEEVRKLIIEGGSKIKLRRFYNRQAKTLSSINARMGQIRLSDMDPLEKRGEMDRMTRMKNNLTRMVDEKTKKYFQ